MSGKGTSFSIIRLNGSPEGWGVVNASGALVHINGMAIRLTRERAVEIAAHLNAEADERGAAGSDDA